MYMTEFFHLLDQIFMLFLYCMKVKKKTPCQFFFPALEVYKPPNFTSSGMQYHTRFKTGNSKAVMPIQDCYFCGFSIPQLFYFEH